MEVHFVTNEKVAETSSKGNQEKWIDRDTNKWYKLDQFGYEALSETLISMLLEESNIEKETPFTFVRYQMERINVHRRERTGCSSDNFLKEGQSIITLSHLLGRVIGSSLKEKLIRMSSDKKRIEYIADATKEYTKLEDFGKYLCMLFEIDSLFLNDDRHLNNIAVIEKNGKYEYCPIFDNGAGLLSDTRTSPFDISPKAIISMMRAKPLNMSFTRQKNTVEGLYGKQLEISHFSKSDIIEKIQPLLEYYPERDRGYITDRVVACIMTRQGKIIS